MRQWNLLRSYPQPEERVIPNRTIEDRILASYRGRDFFDSRRECGYGGMIYDGRWEQTAKDIITDYNPNSIIQLHCEKGFLLQDIHSNFKGPNLLGIDPSRYCQKHSHPLVPIVPRIPEDAYFDLCLALGVVYTLNFPEAMACIRRIQSLAETAFITLAAYETEEDLRLFRKWTLLGTTILKKDEWIEVLKHCGYTGDYWFVTAKTLKLREA